MRFPEVWLAGIAALLLSGFSGVAWSDQGSFSKFAKRFYSYSAPRKPVLESGPLRYENITDNEVREIRKQLDDEAPGDIVSISGVVAACGCEELPACTSQVAVDLKTGDKPRRIILSQVNGKWELGRLQAWWLRLESYASTCQRSGLAAKAELDEGCERQRRGLEESTPRCPAKYK